MNFSQFLLECLQSPQGEPTFRKIFCEVSHYIPSNFVLLLDKNFQTLETQGSLEESQLLCLKEELEARSPHSHYETFTFAEGHHQALAVGATSASPYFFCFVRAEYEIKFSLHDFAYADLFVERFQHKKKEKPSVPSTQETSRFLGNLSISSRDTQ